MFIVELSRGIPSKKYPLNGVFEFDQAKALSEAGHKVIFCAIDLRSIRRKRKFGLTITTIQNIEVYNYSFPLGRVPKWLLSIFAYRGFKKIYKKIVKKYGMPDVIHAHFGRNSYPVLNKASKKFDLKYFVTEHESSILKNEITKNDEKQLSILYNNSLFNIAVSKQFKIFLENKFSVPFNYIPNIVDTTSFTFSYHDFKDTFNYVSVGNLNNGKNFEQIILALSKMVSNNSNVHLTIVGAGEEHDSLVALVEKLNLTNNVTFAGAMKRAQISELYKTQHAFILCSRFETFGVVYIEAMLSGLPVIATKCVDPESLINSENGKLIEVDNIDETVDAMKYIINNYNNYDQKQISDGCLNNYSPQVIANKISDLLNEYVK